MYLEKIRVRDNLTILPDNIIINYHKKHFQAQRETDINFSTHVNGIIHLNIYVFILSCYWLWVFLLDFWNNFLKSGWIIYKNQNSVSSLLPPPWSIFIQHSSAGNTLYLQTVTKSAETTKLETERRKKYTFLIPE